MKRELLIEFEGFRKDSFSPDYDLWLRMLAEGRRILLNPEVLYRYYVGSESSKTSDAHASLNAAISSVEDLIDSGLLSDDQIAEARRAIAYKRALIEKDAEHRRLVAQRERVLARIERLFGAKAAVILTRVIGSASIITVPLRKLLLRATRR
jgi:hypothetical protein